MDGLWSSIIKPILLSWFVIILGQNCLVETIYQLVYWWIDMKADPISAACDWEGSESNCCWKAGFVPILSYIWLVWFAFHDVSGYCNCNIPLKWVPTEFWWTIFLSNDVLYCNDDTNMLLVDITSMMWLLRCKLWWFDYQRWIIKLSSTIINNQQKKRFWSVLEGKIVISLNIYKVVAWIS